MKPGNIENPLALSLSLPLSTDIFFLSCLFDVLLLCFILVTYRLKDGESEYNGRVEVNYLGEWGTICKDKFDALAAKVACKSLGFK